MKEDKEIELEDIQSDKIKKETEKWILNIKDILIELKEIKDKEGSI